MAIEITDFNSLLAAARAEPEPQRLLFIFLQPVLPEEHTEEEARRFHEGQGGALEPVVCVDKGTDELTTFTDLVAESDRTGAKWQVMLIASSPGRDGVEPTEDQIEKALNTMLETVRAGGSLAQFIALNREGEVVQFG